MTETKALLVRIPDWLHARVKEESHRTGESMSMVVRHALEIYLDSFSVLVDARWGFDSGHVLGLRIPDSDAEKVLSKLEADSLKKLLREMGEDV